MTTELKGTTWIQRWCELLYQRLSQFISINKNHKTEDFVGIDKSVMIFTSCVEMSGAVSLRHHIIQVTALYHTVRFDFSTRSLQVSGILNWITLLKTYFLSLFISGELVTIVKLLLSRSGLFETRSWFWYCNSDSFKLQNCFRCMYLFFPHLSVSV